jgi:hypothetical protein
MQEPALTPTIFFSWQSDTPPLTGRNFVERALTRAIDQLAADVELEEAVRDLEVDRDTKGVPGSPKIVDTIFSKIDTAEAFVGDMSFVGRRPNGDPIPNPNVLIEYGWALKSLSHDRVVTLMNTAYGKPDPATLPFDMRHMRFPIDYDLPEDAAPDQIKAVRAKLAKTLAEALRDILKIPKTPPAPPRLFAARLSGESPGRLRPAGHPLAYSDESFFGGSPRPISLAAGSVSWVRLMPRLAVAQTWSFTELKAAATNNFFLIPYGMGRGGADIGWLRDNDGFGTRVMVSEPKDEALWASFIFETGEIWGVDAFTMGASNGYIFIDQPGMVEALTRYRQLLQRLGIAGPYKWIAGLEGVKGRSIAPANAASTFAPRGAALADVIVDGGELLADQDPAAAVRSFVARAYDRCGLPPPT